MNQGPQFSADGKWWWNGTEWRPASEAPQGPAPPPAPPPPPPFFTPSPPGAQQPPPPGPAGPAPARPRRRGCLWAAGAAVLVLVGIGVCTAAVNSGQKTASTTPTSVPTATPASSSGPATPKPTPLPPTPPPAPRVLLDLQGNGIKSSPEFDAPSHWRLHYTYDCSSFGSKGNFQVYVEEGNTPVAIPVNELAASGDSTTDVYDGGHVHLEMNSECTWHVTATTA